MKFCNSIFAPKCSSLTYRKHFLAEDIISFLVGSAVANKSFLYLLMNVPLTLLLATFSSISAAIISSAFISFKYAFQAFLFASVTSFFASFSKISSSSSDSTKRKISPVYVSNSKSKIHFRILAIQSWSCSHCNLSLSLYLS